MVHDFLKIFRKPEKKAPPESVKIKINEETSNRIQLYALFNNIFDYFCEKKNYILKDKDENEFKISILCKDEKDNIFIDTPGLIDFLIINNFVNEEYKTKNFVYPFVYCLIKYFIENSDHKISIITHDMLLDNIEGFDLYYLYKCLNFNNIYQFLKGEVVEL